MVITRLTALLLLWASPLQLLVAEELPPLPAVSPSVLSSEGQAVASDDLLAMIEDATTLATKTRMNADFVPGFMSVLHGDELVALGVRTVAEALTLVPGVQVNRGQLGRYLVSIRGLQHGNGNIKVLLDSVAINDAYSGYAAFGNILVEQIERIEMIRGPGSAVHGEYAFAGVINIVTRRGENRVHLRAGSNDTYGAGGIFTLQDRARNLRLDLNVSGWKTRGADIVTGTDFLHEFGLGTFSRAPGPLGNGEENGLTVLSLKAGNFSLLASYTRERSDPFFGLGDVLSPTNAAAQLLSREQGLVQARQELHLADSLEAELQLSWLRTRNELQDEIWPPGLPYPTLTGNVFPDGLLERVYSQTRRWEAGLDLRWNGWTNHRWLLEFTAAEIRLEDAAWEFNADLETLEPLPAMRRYTGDLNFIQEGASRSIQSLAVQDQYRFGDRLEMTAGLRYDRYSDVGDSLSPRLAAVWRLADSHLLKAQYAEAFLPPSLLQVYGLGLESFGGFDSPLDPETTATTELGYVFRRNDTVARATLFHSDLENLIVFEQSSYVNRGRVRLQGVETEWEQRLGQAWKLAANLSYTDTLDRETGGPLGGTANWLGNLSLFYRPSHDLLLSGRWRCVGERQRAVDDARNDPLDGYNDLALTLNWFDAGIPGLTLRAGIKNLLGEKIVSPASPLTYREDYPWLEERTWWAQLSYRLD